MSKDKEKELTEEQEPRSARKEILEWVKIILIAAALAVLIDMFIIVNSVVPSGSMETTIMPGSRMFGFRLSYIFNGPERGDIVIFKYPDNETQTFVKRVIGLPGDVVQIKGGVTYVNGEELDEPYLNETPRDLDFGPYDVPENSYFMMGDNRNHSNDARYWNNKFVRKDKILGKALLVYWPFSRFGVLK